MCNTHCVLNTPIWAIKLLLDYKVLIVLTYVTKIKSIIRPFFGQMIYWSVLISTKKKFIQNFFIEIANP